MTESADEKAKQPQKKSQTPEQKLGDTPVAPWDMPNPAEKAQAKPVRRALKEAISEVDSPEKADEVIEHLTVANGDQKTEDVQKEQPATTSSAAAADQVQQAADQATTEHRTEDVLDATAKVLTTPDKRQREVISQAVQEVLNPQQQGAKSSGMNERKRAYLRDAVLRRLKPIDALDANLFLFVNHLPHTRLLNSMFYSLTVIFNGGTFWYIVSAIAALRDSSRLRKIWRNVVIPLTLTTLLVEHPIKAYFRRRRPFITIIQAIVIGKKPGTWSFPSGHSAAAFSGAWLLNRALPRFRLLRYVLAGMVAFSRTYLGDHYPGDVASGSLIGMLLSMLFLRLFGTKR